MCALTLEWVARAHTTAHMLGWPNAGRRDRDCARGDGLWWGKWKHRGRRAM